MTIMDRGYRVCETCKGILFDSAPGYPDTAPIIDYSGSRDHRGRYAPVSGCGCMACRTSGLALHVAALGGK